MLGQSDSLRNEKCAKIFIIFHQATQCYQCFNSIPVKKSGLNGLVTGPDQNDRITQVHLKRQPKNLI